MGRELSRAAALAVVVVLGWEPALARACTGLLPECVLSVNMHQVAPATASVDVPRNVELRVGTGPTRPARAIDVDAVLVLSSDEGDVPITWTSGGDGVHRYLVGQLERLLEPATVYRLRHVLACDDPDAGLVTPHVPDGSPATWCSPCTRSWNTTLSTFTTGTTIDTSAPAPPMIGRVDMEPLTEAAAGNTCSGWSGCAFRARATAEPEAVLRVRDAAGVIVTDEPWSEIAGFELLTGAIHSELGRARDGNNYGYNAPMAAGTYQVTAVDRAGNESTPVPLVVPPCSPRDDDGCSLALTPASRRPSQALLLLALGALLAVRRARRT